jgi:hypothetical protein
MASLTADDRHTPSCEPETWPFGDGRHAAGIRMPESFETFLRIWTAENIHPLADHGGDWNSIVRRTADELTDAAAIAGFYGELVEAVKPYGGVAGFVQSKFEEAG